MEVREQLNETANKSPAPAIPRALSTLAVVDALLGKNEIAIAEAKRAVEMVPISKDAVDAVTTRRGAGTALIEALVSRLRAEGVSLLRVTTTNDNLDALRFYQRRGFRIIAVRPGAVDESRRVKPSIPATGEYGIPIRDEIELERRV
jgi:GNAT superfamily N-acetyltransferase